MNQPTEPTYAEQCAAHCKTMTLQQFYDELERHDWNYMMSDSDEVYQRGKANAERIGYEANAIPGGIELLKKYTEHILSGSCFYSGVKPIQKPERPTQ